MSEADNRAGVRRCNLVVIQNGEEVAFDAWMAPDFINRSARAGSPAGREGRRHTFRNGLRPALSALTVTFHGQPAEPPDDCCFVRRK